MSDHHVGTLLNSRVSAPVTAGLFVRVGGLDSMEVLWVLKEDDLPKFPKDLTVPAIGMNLRLVN